MCSEETTKLTRNLSKGYISFGVYSFGLSATVNCCRGVYILSLGLQFESASSKNYNIFKILESLMMELSFEYKNKKE
jgi:hypothetical protein